MAQYIPGCRSHLLLLRAADGHQLVEMTAELLLVLQAGLRPLQLLHHHEGGGHVSEGHHAVGHLTDGDGERVDVAGLVVAQQVLLQDLRGQPGQVGADAVERETVEVGSALPCGLELGGEPQARDHGCVAFQEDVGGSQCSVDDTLVVEVVQTLADVSHHQADEELGQTGPGAEHLAGEDVPDAAVLRQGSHQPHLAAPHQAGHTAQDVLVLKLPHGRHLVQDVTGDVGVLLDV